LFNTYIHNYASSLIFFAYWDRRRLLAVGREDVPKVIGRIPKYQFGANYILIFLPMGKVANNFIL
jgi:hypothetical protein